MGEGGRTDLVMVVMMEEAVGVEKGSRGGGKIFYVCNTKDMRGLDERTR